MKRDAKPISEAKVPALAEDDVEALLLRIGRADQYRAGLLTCSSCGATVRRGDLAAIRYGVDEYEFCCGQLDCLEAFHGGR